MGKGGVTACSYRSVKEEKRSYYFKGKERGGGEEDKLLGGKRVSRRRGRVTT